MLWCGGLCCVLYFIMDKINDSSWPQDDRRTLHHSNVNKIQENKKIHENKTLTQVSQRSSSLTYFEGKTITLVCKSIVWYLESGIWWLWRWWHLAESETVISVWTPPIITPSQPGKLSKKKFNAIFYWQLRGGKERWHFQLKGFLWLEMTKKWMKMQ